MKEIIVKIVNDGAWQFPDHEKNKCFGENTPAYAIAWRIAQLLEIKEQNFQLKISTCSIDGNSKGACQ
jgi:hypothetical protein